MFSTRYIRPYTARLMARALSQSFALLLACALLASCGQSGASDSRGPVVVAAASLQESLGEIGEAWQAHGHAAPVLSFAASSAVARQVEQGAPADIVVTADEDWMRWLARREALEAGSARDIVGNRLVVIGSLGARPAGGVAEALAAHDGPLAIAEPHAVPAGRYARAALQSLGLWRSVRARIVPAENVRAALALVERGEASLGIVYASDALASQRVSVLAAIPPASHAAIRYPAALVAGTHHEDAAEFLEFLTSAEAQAIFAAHGFAGPGQ